MTVKTLAVDFAQVREKDYDEIERIVSQYTVSILVNNVAVSHSMPTPFLEESEEQLQQIIDINITATLRMTKICLPPMAERKHGLIVNIGSFAGIVPTALLQTYSGSKAFLKTWSESLGAELKPVGVRVTHLNTYFVVSNMSKISRASLMVPTARDYVRAALKRLGGSKTHVTPYPWHNIMQWAMEKFVGHQLLIDKTCEMQQSIRKRALRKLAKQQ